MSEHHHLFSSGHRLSEGWEWLSFWLNFLIFLALTPLCFSITSSKRVLGLISVTAFELKHQCVGQQRSSWYGKSSDERSANICWPRVENLTSLNFPWLSSPHLLFHFLCLYRGNQSWRNHDESIWPTSLNASSPFSAPMSVQRRPTCRACRSLLWCCSQNTDTTTWWDDVK